MKALAIIQRGIALITLIVGLFFMLCEVPIDQSASSQAWLTVGGFVIAVLSVGWLVLIGEEEELFIHEAR